MTVRHLFISFVIITTFFTTHAINEFRVEKGWVLKSERGDAAMADPAAAGTPGGNGGKARALQLTPPSLIPPFTQFHQQPLCTPASEEVVVVNANPRHDLHLYSLSSDSSDFHCSWFVDDVVAPGKNTTFTVLYLGREVGRVETTITVSTSHGDLQYEVFAEGVGSPHRTRPLLSGTVPVGTVFSQPINVYNPLHQTLKITEVYSSNKDLTLTVPGSDHTSGASQIPSAAWEIPPFQSKTIVVLEVPGKAAGASEGYINIRTNVSDANLIVAADVRIEDEAGLYFGPGAGIDFGTVFRNSGNVLRDLSLYFNGKGAATIVNARVNSCEHSVDPSLGCPQITFHMDQPSLASGSWAVMGHIRLTTVKRDITPGQYRGLVSIEYRTTLDNTIQVLTIPFVVDALDGSLDMPHPDTVFFTQAPIYAKQTKTVTITNNFNYPLIISKIALPMTVHTILQLSNVEPDVLLPKGTKTFSLTFSPTALLNTISTSVFVYCNATTEPLRLPVFTYTGELKVFFDKTTKNDVIDFGTLVMSEKKTASLFIVNPNPLPISLLTFSADLDAIDLELIGLTPSETMIDLVEFGRLYPQAPLSRKPEDRGDVSAAHSKDIGAILNPGYIASFRIHAEYKREEKINSRFYITTSFQALALPIAYQAVVRTLQLAPNPIQFLPTFPNPVLDGIVTSFNAPMEAHGVFAIVVDDGKEALAIKNVNIGNSAMVVHMLRDDLLTPRKTPASTAVAAGGAAGAGQVTRVHFADLTLDMSIGLPNPQHHYMPVTDKAGIWLASLGEADVAELKRANKAWDRVVKDGLTNVTTALSIDTTAQEGVMTSVHFSLYKPVFVNTTTLRFPFTQVKHTSVLNLTVINPTVQPIIFQVLPLSHFSEMVSFPALTELFAINADSVKAARAAKDMFFVSGTEKSHFNFPIFTLPPFQTATVPIAYRPTSMGSASSYLVFRNNFTSIEMVRVKGESGRGNLSFPSTQRFFQNGTLVFPVTEEDLGKCEETTHVHSFVYNFTVVNRGNMQVSAEELKINGQPCASGPFVIENCAPFVLDPKKQHKLVIRFTPDFTAYAVQASLTVTLGGSDVPLIFPMAASLPPHLVSVCYERTPGPPWAATVRVAVVALTAVLGAVLLAVECLYGQWPSPLSLFSSSKAKATAPAKRQNGTAPHTPDADGESSSEPVSSATGNGVDAASSSSAAAAATSQDRSGSAAGLTKRAKGGNAAPTPAAVAAGAAAAQPKSNAPSGSSTPRLARSESVPTHNTSSGALDEDGVNAAASSKGSKSSKDSKGSKADGKADGKAASSQQAAAMHRVASEPFTRDETESVEAQAQAQGTAAKTPKQKRKGGKGEKQGGAGDEDGKGAGQSLPPSRKESPQARRKSLDDSEDEFAEKEAWTEKPVGNKVKDEKKAKASTVVPAPVAAVTPAPAPAPAPAKAAVPAGTASPKRPTKGRAGDLPMRPTGVTAHSAIKEVGALPAVDGAERLIAMAQEAAKANLSNAAAAGKGASAPEPSPAATPVAAAVVPSPSPAPAASKPAPATAAAAGARQASPRTAAAAVAGTSSKVSPDADAAGSLSSSSAEASPEIAGGEPSSAVRPPLPLGGAFGGASASKSAPVAVGPSAPAAPAPSLSWGLADPIPGFGSSSSLFSGLSTSPSTSSIISPLFPVASVPSASSGTWEPAWDIADGASSGATGVGVGGTSSAFDSGVFQPVQWMAPRVDSPQRSFFSSISSSGSSHHRHNSPPNGASGSAQRAPPGFNGASELSGVNLFLPSDLGRDIFGGLDDGQPAQVLFDDLDWARPAAPSGGSGSSMFGTGFSSAPMAAPPSLPLHQPHAQALHRPQQQQPQHHHHHHHHHHSQHQPLLHHQPLGPQHTGPTGTGTTASTSRLNPNSPPWPAPAPSPAPGQQRPGVMPQGQQQQQQGQPPAKAFWRWN